MEEMESSKTQVTRNHYDLSNYLDEKRWASYLSQIIKITEIKPESVLYIGAGDGIVPSAIRAQGIDVKTFDFDSDLLADFIGDIREIGRIVPPKSFDVVACCQVLEHIPYKDFVGALVQLRSIAKRRVLVSLPYAHKQLLEVSIKLPKMPLIRGEIALPRFWRKWEFDGQHHWELGAKDTSIRTVEAAIASVYEIEERFFVRGNRYHRFYILGIAKL